MSIGSSLIFISVALMRWTFIPSLLLLLLSIFLPVRGRRYSKNAYLTDSCIILIAFICSFEETFLDDVTPWWDYALIIILLIIDDYTSSMTVHLLQLLAIASWFVIPFYYSWWYFWPSIFHHEYCVDTYHLVFLD